MPETQRIPWLRVQLAVPVVLSLRVEYVPQSLGPNCKLPLNWNPYDILNTLFQKFMSLWVDSFKPHDMFRYLMHCKGGTLIIYLIIRLSYFHQHLISLILLQAVHIRNQIVQFLELHFGIFLLKSYIKSELVINKSELVINFVLYWLKTIR